MISEHPLVEPILLKLKLLDRFTTTLSIDSTTFTYRLAELAEFGDISVSSANKDDPFTWTEGKDLKGYVGFDGFEVQSVNETFKSAIAIGTLSEENGKVTIETEIRGFDDTYIIISAVSVVVFIGWLIWSVVNAQVPDVFALVAPVIVMALYFTARFSVAGMKRSLTEKFAFIDKIARQK